MKYQKITNLLDDSSNKTSKFRTNWVEKMTNLEEHTMLEVQSNLKLLC